MNNYIDAAEELKSRKTGKDDITIEPVRKALKALDRPDKDYKVVLVGGTNGKGSTVEMISEMLQHQNRKVGISESPHLTTIRERIQINSQNISRKDFLELYNQLEELDVDLSFFEAITVMGYLYFSKKNVDYAIMEVGMGGRLDATNAAEPDLSVITNVGLDHTAFLGDSREEIAAEKAGIIPENGQIVTGESLDPIIETANQRGSKLVKPAKIEKIADRKYRFKEREFSVPVRGDFQRQNLQNSLAAIKELEEVPDNLEAALSGLSCSGRMEKISQNPEIFLDGAHNPAALEKVISDLPEQFTCVFNALETKDSSEMIKILEEKASRFVFTESSKKASIASLELQKSCSINSETVKDSIDAVREAVKYGEPVVVTGSLYLISQLKQKDLNLKTELQTKKVQ